MTELFEPSDAHDHRLALRARHAGGLLADGNAAGLLTAADVHVATRTAALGGEEDERVLLAVALLVRAVRRGAVALDLDGVRDLAPLAWPEPDGWLAAVRDSPLTAAGLLHVDDGLVYLDRYHRLEVQVADDLRARADLDAPAVDEDRLTAGLEALGGDHFSPEQQQAAEQVVRSRTAILTGGPGTGKTTTVARILLLLADQAHARGERLSVALAAPTGKAATRLEEAVAGELAALAGPTARPGAAELARRAPRLAGVTLHRLLGWRPDNATRFRHDRDNRLGFDVVVVDESSMVDLTMTGRLLEAVRPQARLLLVGDPEQLTSVGAGAVLGDLVEAATTTPGLPVAPLRTNHRSTTHINDLAASLRAGDADGVLEVLARDTDEVGLVEVDGTEEAAGALREVCLPAARSVRDAARSGDVAAALAGLDSHRLLCAHREGPWGVAWWNRQVERWLAEDDEEHGVAPTYGPFYAGRPLLVTENDYTLDLYNGETGVVVPAADGRLRAHFGGGRQVAPGRIGALETMHAMTVHKSQGSQADTVTVLLPDADSRLLTRELFYTAVTRAQRRIRVVGSPEAVRVAVAARAQRATGLAQRLAAARR
ncbi:exodeoxyribonuclease V subunit alpha [Nocardioides sp. CFH 31398]|uniref:exodeoxyribonuclease V subunit alpha n=1 Tax=Nocardioides sp. CFH 31398 TaxID=2919579 RepID=UPI001F05906D|nr:exodeoxyribonuclease V subunit alpha [Nocardioides sp. CFH 31398]MCH1865419.1 exodeoxyribonuclease V subunit alpha [Nocardioides sp. CFH 31398]